VRFFDTAAMYAGGRSEALLGRVLEPVRSNLTLLTKGGVSYADLSDLRTGRRDSSYEALRASLEGSLTRLRTDVVDVYLIHQCDHTRTPEEAMENLRRLVEEGMTRAVGFSNFGPEQCQRALATGIPSYVEYSFSLLDRRYVHELDAAGAAGCRRLSYGTFVHGMLAEDLSLATVFNEEDWRHRARTSTTAVNSGAIFFTGDAYARNIEVAGQLRAIAAGMGVSLASLVVALTRREPHTDLMLFGCRSVAELEENLAAMALELPDDVVEAAGAVLTAADRPTENKLSGQTYP
jgi:aryl-alcohol dehydrogenase-like predicted oxidoreductase